MSLIRHLLTLIGLVSVIAIGLATFQLKDKLKGFDEGAAQVYLDLGIKLLETKNSAEATVFKVPVDEDVSVIALSLKDDLYEKLYSNIEEVNARGGKIFAICSDGDEKLQKISKAVFKIPKLRWELIPLLESIPIQLFSYYVALHKGTDIDKPRNLAKSVTVE